MTKRKGFFLERAVCESEAFRQLSGTAIRIYLAFLSKRRMEKRKVGRKAAWTILNNGEIEFTYKEAQGRHGIKQGAFCSNRDRLIDVGLIDIAHNGAGLYKSKTLYTISDRWKEFGTPDFKLVRRKKDARHVGYQRQKSER